MDRHAEFDPGLSHAQNIYREPFTRGLLVASAVIFGRCVIAAVNGVRFNSRGFRHPLHADLAAEVVTGTGMFILRPSSAWALPALIVWIYRVLHRHQITEPVQSVAKGLRHRP